MESETCTIKDQTDQTDSPETANVNDVAEKLFDLQTETKLESVHPQHWCGQHKFDADSPTNFYDYTSLRHKDKSAMSRIAEIARFNKIRHFYDLQDESGPAHKKLFTVRLVLTADEAFEGSGPSIKRAQQASAEIALRKTKLPLPAEKVNRKKANDIMKPHRVLQNVCRTLQYPNPHYISCNPPVYPDPGCPVPEHILLPPSAFALYQPQFPSVPIDSVRPHGPKLQAVIVNIHGKSVATGLGETYPLAKQDAASKALAILTPILREHQSMKSTDNVGVQEPVPVHMQKSVISDIHERAHQLKLNVIFEVLKEEGPPHDRHYEVRCAFVTTGNSVTAEATGTGKKKKIAQQEACARLLKTVEHLGHENNPITLASNVCKTQKKLEAMNREPKRKTIVKDRKMDPLYGHQINPVSRLIQVTQTKNQEHPTFELVAEHGQSKYKEFTIRVKCGDEVQEGKGPNKRLAKRAAAEAMLESIGYVKPLPPPGKSLLKKLDPQADTLSWEPSTEASLVEASISVSETETRTEQSEPSEVATSSPKPDEDGKREGSPDSERKRVTFNSEVHACPPPGDQDYPNSYVQSLKKDAIVEGKIRRIKRSKEHRRSLTAEQITELSEQVKEFLSNRTNGSNDNDDSSSSAISQLHKLSVNFKFSVQYTPFPEASPNQHFTIVCLGLEEPLVGHGTGSSTAEADENSALAALEKLKDLEASKKQ